ncbi:MAG: asparagine synthase (glutamine-hydrolyzing) [Bacteroidetes bacterium]|nr:asparagine synthase (glutamine-hydrolyzing) [Bacteroidota bacterium]
MCGIAGFYNTKGEDVLYGEDILSAMSDTLHHRGPDDSGYYISGPAALGFKRLSIVDLRHGQQPMFSKDETVAMICNGEIYNYKELQKELIAKGHTFKTNCDVEVVLHGYIQYGIDFFKRLNGQFAFVIYDKVRNLCVLGRDHFGICPMFYTTVDNHLVFASEIKAILKFPSLKKEVNVKGLDQILSFPGLVSPVSMFKNIHSLKPGHILTVKNTGTELLEYWDLDYPDEGQDYGNRPESYYVEKLEELLLRSVKYRLNADVDIGFYLSGGLDSSLIAALIRKTEPSKNFPSFSISFPERENAGINESYYQRKVASLVGSEHNEVEFLSDEIHRRLKHAVYHSECPLKETYNTCSLALSELVNKQGIKVILSGEGADEFFGGYVGYRFDVQRGNNSNEEDIDLLLENQSRQMLWGDAHFFYEKKYREFSETKKALYSDDVNFSFDSIDSTRSLGLNKSRIVNKNVFHKRSYIDLKVRLSDHLISDHCDRVAYANSVEGRYPFLDIDLINFVTQIPPHIQLKDLVEKYILKQVASKYLPPEIINRQKFAFVAPGSTHLLKQNIDWVNDLLSPQRIKRQGYFNPDTVEFLRKKYSQEGFQLNVPYENDLLITVITFNIWLDTFGMPSFS